jgi:hypothetical protein
MKKTTTMKFILLLFLFFSYQVVTNCKRKEEGEDFVSYFAICAVAKNEPDIHEWVEYHHKMGVGKFYIYDNGDLNEAQFLQDYISKGIVEVFIETNIAPQLKTYNRCIKERRKQHQFIGFIDIDEFIVTKNGCSIPSIMRRYEPYGGLTLNWKIFGSSGHIKKPPGAILGNYWQCFRVGHLKSTANTDFVVSHAGNPHAFFHMKTHHAVDSDFIKVSGAVNPPRDSLYEIIYLQHYHLKSLEEYEVNSKRGRASTTKKGRIKNMDYFHQINAKCNENCTLLTMPKDFAHDCPLDMFENRPISFE